MQAVLEVLAENVAVFLEETLPESKVNEVEEMAPEVESKEVRDWGNWLESVMDTATNWGKWIHDKVNEAEEKARLKVANIVFTCVIQLNELSEFLIIAIIFLSRT